MHPIPLPQPVRHAKCAAAYGLSSSALGDNDLFIVDMPGRSNLDLYYWIKAREKLNKYSLDAIATHFLGDTKLDMPYKEMFRKLDGSADDVAEVGLYCGKSVYLLILLTIRLAIVPDNVEMSRVCHTLMELLVTSGQQIKIMNQLFWEVNRDTEGGAPPFIINQPAEFSGKEDDKYEGATVIDAKAAFYREPIAVLDFMSLYPSIMLAGVLASRCWCRIRRISTCRGSSTKHISTSARRRATGLWSACRGSCRRRCFASSSRAADLEEAKGASDVARGQGYLRGAPKGAQGVGQLDLRVHRCREDGHLPLPGGGRQRGVHGACVPPQDGGAGDALCGLRGGVRRHRLGDGPLPRSDR